VGAAASDENFAVVSGIFYLQGLYLTNSVAPDLLVFKAKYIYIDYAERQRLYLYMVCLYTA